MNLFDAHKDMQEWMTAFGQEVPENPIVPAREILDLRWDLIHEEVNIELLPALDFLGLNALEQRDDFRETLDGLADNLFVTIGTFVALGVPTEEVYKEVCRSNWTKFWTPFEIASKTKISLGDGSLVKEVHHEEFTATLKTLPTSLEDRVWLVKNKSGKVIKSPSFSPPNFDKWLPTNLQ